MRDLPLVGPKQRQQLAGFITDHRQAMIGVGAVRAEEMFVAASIVFATRQSSDAETDAKLDQYAEGLADIPADLLNLALKRAQKVYKFLPTIAEIRACMKDELGQRFWRLKALEYMAIKHDREWKGPPAPPATEDERRQIAEAAASLARKLSTSDGPSHDR